MSAQIPHGPEDKDCPKWLESMSKRCHRCPLWVQVKGQHPQNEHEQVDHWDCSLAWGPILQTEIIRSLHAVQKAVESRGNDTIKMVAEGIIRQERQHNEAMGTVAQSRLAHTNGHEAPKLLSAGEGS